MNSTMVSASLLSGSKGKAKEHEINYICYWCKQGRAEYNFLSNQWIEYWKQQHLEAKWG